MLDIEFDETTGYLKITLSTEKAQFITESDNDMNLSFVCNEHDDVIGVILLNINDVVDNFPIGYWDNHPDKELIPEIILKMLNFSQQKKSKLF